ncbi:hypothetical protein N0V82_006434 [Gnomoniopsis sp. IMI 355080]|nr:hypothetical protein N0V82_006434 [Gnomoniopsis sp. IMI 355080]
MDLGLPPLSIEPKRYSDFCLSISLPLIHSLTGIFTEAANKSNSNLILSVGSGSGLLEAYLQSHWSATLNCNLSVHGVEIYSEDDARPVNRYLPEQYCDTVKATWQLSPVLHAAAALLFVYPRDVKLVSRYLEAVQAQENSPLQAVVWLGPRADFDTFAVCLRAMSNGALQHNVEFGPVEVIETSGLAEYEMMALIHRDT